MTEKIFGQINEKGKFIPYNQDQLIQAFKKLSGKRAEITVRPETKSRTNEQNRYLWGVVYKYISEEIGYEPEQVHELMKFKFLKIEILVKGNPETVIRSTTDLSTEEFNQYVERIVRWAAEFLSVSIPEPNEV